MNMVVKFLLKLGYFEKGNKNLAQNGVSTL